jgi:hypothetical protein
LMSIDCASKGRNNLFTLLFLHKNGQSVYLS